MMQPGQSGETCLYVEENMFSCFGWIILHFGIEIYRDYILAERKDN